jgi:lipopolysaccharide transport system permease protein
MDSVQVPEGVPSFDLIGGAPRQTRQRLALLDVREGLALYRLAYALGWLDIKLRYRGSVLGPFWLTLSTAIMVLSMGVLYAELFHMDLSQYLPFLALSLVLWNALSGMVTEAGVCFTTAEGTIRSMRMPFTVHAARAVIRNILVLAHNALVFVGVFAWFNVWPHPAMLGPVAFGLLLWILDSFAICVLLGAFCARFRDIPPIIASLMQIAFFLTPIIWKPELIGARAVYLVANPFYPLLAVMRDPLLNANPGHLIWATAVGWSVLLWIGAWLLFVRVRGRLAFWV